MKLFGPWFGRQATGNSSSIEPVTTLGRELHGNGVHFDNLETHDTRQVIPGIGCTIEPGIYLQGKFGVRNEINIYISPEGPEVTTPTQDELLVLSPHHS